MAAAAAARTWQHIVYYQQQVAQSWRHVTTHSIRSKWKAGRLSSKLVIEVGGTFVVKEFVVVFFFDFLWHVIDPPLLVLLCFCVLRFCRRPPRPIIIIASSILYQQRLGISQIPATFHEIPVKCSSWIWWRSWTEGLKNSRFSLKWQNLFKPKFNIFLAATQSRFVCMTIRKESRKIK